MFQSLLNCEWVFISQVIYRINQCNTYEEFANICICNLKGLFDFSLGVMFQAGIANGKPKLSTPYSIDANNQYYDVSYYLEGCYNPKWLDYFFCPWSSVFRYSDISQEAEWTESRIYKEVLEPINLYYGLYNTLIYNDTVLGALVLWRSKDSGDFTPREIYIMECLKNHLALKLYMILNKPAVVCGNSHTQQNAASFFAKKYSLTKRETEIVNMLSANKDTADICQTLFISPSTFRKHIYNIYKKTGVNNRSKLVQLVLKQ